MLPFYFINFLYFFVFCINFSVCFKNDGELYYTTKSENNKITVHKAVNKYISDDWIAKAFYKNDINNTGFAYLEIETNQNALDTAQAIHAGYIEGNVTHDLIYSQWFNVVNDFRNKHNKSTCNQIDKYLKSNFEWISQKAISHQDDPYWYHIHLIYKQIYGMYKGYNENTKNNLTLNDILWSNLLLDVMYLYEGIEKTSFIGDGHCSALIKILPHYEDIYIGHNTWFLYQSMLRIQKKYNFKYHIAPKFTNKHIPGYEVSFSSYPGTITSIDDFYLSSAGLAITETTNEVYNTTLWEYLKPEDSVFVAIRSVLANRLANSGKEWSDIFKLYNSGTYNNQWMILDYKKFKPGRKPYNDTFWVVEQMPSLVISKDLTDILINKTYWSSYNVPYYKEIYDISGYNDMYKKHGDWFTHEGSPRAKIFKRDYIKVNDMDSFMALMRSNNYKNEPFARCKCNPPYTAAGAIASRADLNPKNGTYQFKGLGHKPSGATDAKITNSNLFMKLQFMAVSGPTIGTNGVLPPFQWSTSDFNGILPHISQPDVWNFQPVLHKWQNL